MKHWRLLAWDSTPRSCLKVTLSFATDLKWPPTTEIHLTSMQKSSKSPTHSHLLSLGYISNAFLSRHRTTYLCFSLSEAIIFSDRQFTCTWTSWHSHYPGQQWWHGHLGWWPVLMGAWAWPRGSRWKKWGSPGSSQRPECTSCYVLVGWPAATP